ncbi:hypothetical protein CLV76_1069 [Marivita geojedonensis]|nr:hypothetical protein CLV76_1069 [Marivita geojedonensis]
MAERMEGTFRIARTFFEKIIDFAGLVTTVVGRNEL